MPSTPPRAEPSPSRVTSSDGRGRASRPEAELTTDTKHPEQSSETMEPRTGLSDEELAPVLAKADELRAELERHRHGELVAGIVETAVKLLRDRTNRGDLKLIRNSLKELRYALTVFAPHVETRKVSIFGSARTLPSHPDYASAERFARQLVGSGWMVITGAGGGIMAAGHGGAGAEPSFGLNISLPFEQSANEHIDGDPKLVNFKYFFTRKLMFVRSSDAIALFPGGFGTMDEGFEVLTLVQTGKAVPTPIVFVDQPGGDYWRQWQDYVEQQLLRRKLISPDDLRLYKITDSVDEAAHEVRHFFENYHSIRYTRDRLILRLKRPVTDSQRSALAEEFADITVGGPDAWRTGGPLKVERNEPGLAHLHRLVFPFNRRDHGRLRILIDRLNDLPA